MNPDTSLRYRLSSKTVSEVDPKYNLAGDRPLSGGREARFCTDPCGSQGHQLEYYSEDPMSKLYFCYDRGGFPGDTLDRVRKYGVNAQELVTTSSTRLLMTT